MPEIEFLERERQNALVLIITMSARWMQVRLRTSCATLTLTTSA
jgi:hypothetical protein